MERTLRRLSILALLIGLISSNLFGQIATPPVIDGDGSDAVWDAVTAMELLREYDYSGTTDAADLSGSIKTLWDADNIYVLLEVLDDSLHQRIRHVSSTTALSASNQLRVPFCVSK